MFSPQLSGKKYPSGDTISYKAKSHETKAFYKETGKRSHWNPSMFSGLPEGLLVLGREGNLLSKFKKALTFGIHRPIGLFFQIGFICFLALCLLGISPWICLIASLAYSLNPNYIILFEAGHMTKLDVVSFFPLIVVGTLLCFRKDYFKGVPAIAIGTSLAVYGNHIQMVYYLIFGLVIMGIVHFIYSLKNRTLPSFAKGSIIALAAAALAGFSNFSQLYSSKSFSEDTMRGKPILEQEVDREAISSSETNGLEWGYAMSWSHDVKDVMAMFIPRFVGGASNERIAPKSEAGKLMRSIGIKQDKGKFLRTPAYWGNLTFTSGTSYMGITLLMLFIFSLFVLEPKMRWTLLGVTLLLTLFSMGRHASWLNKTLFDYIPLFNKFRSPNSVVNVIPFFLAVGSVLGLHKLLNTENKKQYLKPLLYSVSLLGGMALLIAFLGSSLFGFLKDSELGYDENVQNILRDARISMQKSDAWRTLFFILAAGGVIWTYLSGKIKNQYFLIIGLGFLMVFDLVQVDKRYMKSYDFIKESQYNSQFAASNNDKYIVSREPKGKGFYRVLDLSTNTFNDAKPSYHHHQIGGYDAAKLQRYQDVIDKYISKIYTPVLNMLNAKYVIGQDQQISTNTAAYGTAWFVTDILTANSAREEINALDKIGLDTTAVILAKEFSNQSISAGNGNGSIELIQFQPNKLTYKSSSNSDQIAIFSEIWYGPNKGWKVTIDGQKVDHFRANYILRGLSVPKGQHEIVFEFKPEAKLTWLSLISSLLIIAFTIGAIVMYFRKSDETSEDTKTS